MRFLLLQVVAEPGEHRPDMPSQPASQPPLLLPFLPLSPSPSRTPPKKPPIPFSPKARLARVILLAVGGK